MRTQRASRLARRLAPLTLELAAALGPSSGPFLFHLDRTRASLGRALSPEAFSLQLAQALTMTLAFDGTPSSLVEQLLAVPVVGATIASLLLPGRPASVERTVERMRELVSCHEPIGDPHAWCELVFRTTDAASRRDHGFYLTPPPLARFVVRAVDGLLRRDAGLSEGLADPMSWRDAPARLRVAKVPPSVDPGQTWVSILDPAAGTGVFLIETLRWIHRTLTLVRWNGLDDQRRAAAWSSLVRDSLLHRLRGIEIAMGPYAVAHLAVRRAFEETGCRLQPHETPRILLADALASPAVCQRSEHGVEVARLRDDGDVTVVLGNPPYFGAAPPAEPWMEQLMLDYKTSVRSEERQIQRLSNLYLRFLRLVEWMTDQSGAVFAGLVTDVGWGEGVLYRDVRRSWIERAGSMSWFDLGGGSREQGTDESLFAIRQGTAATIARLGPKGTKGAASVAFRRVRGRVEEKLSLLADSAPESIEAVAVMVEPPRYLFVPSHVGEDYRQWPSLIELAGSGDPASDRDHRYGTGVKTRHDGFVVGMTAREAVERVRRLARREESDGSLREQMGLCTTAHFRIADARRRSEAPVQELESLVRPLAYRPFDERCVVYDRAFVCEPKKRLMRHLLRSGNVALAALRQDRTGHVSGYLVARGLIAKDMVSSCDDALIWPLFVERGDPAEGQTQLVPNLSARGVEVFSRATGLSFRAGWEREGGADGYTAWDVLAYVYAILWSPTYRSRNAEALCRDFPRIPVPASAEVFRALASAGESLCSLHLDPVPCAVQGRELFGCRVVGVRRDAAHGRVWLNDRSWIHVPEDAWGMVIGNHSVCRDWLEARRGIELDSEAIERFGGIVRALVETRRKMDEIDATIESHGGWRRAFAGNQKLAETCSPPTVGRTAAEPQRV